MAIIAPFRGYRYNPSVVGDLSKVVTPPYDNIDQTQQADYYNRSEHSVVRIIKGQTKETDTPNDNQYTRAAKFWEEWIEERALTREPGPAIYPYHQEYTVDGNTYIRKGLISLVGLDDPYLRVRAHEKTLTGPKADRLKLMKATEANDGLIFMLYDDPEQKTNALLGPEVDNAKPIMEVTDDFGAIHRLYRVTRPGVIRELGDVFHELELFIADGHHRFETAVNYMRYCKDRKWEPVSAESFNHRMMAMVSLQDPGLTVLPTHRAIHSVEGFNPENFLTQISDNFEVQEFDENAMLYAAMDEAVKNEKIAFGFAANGLHNLRLITMKNPDIMNEIVGTEKSEAWRKLDVTVLHFALLDKYLGIGEEALAAETNVKYYREKDKALAAVAGGEFQAVFFVNPTRLDQVREVALAGERMPQKSTDFFPKLLTGMVMMKMNIDKSNGLAMYEADEE